MLVLLLGNHAKVCSVKLDALVGAGLFLPSRDFLCTHKKSVLLFLTGLEVSFFFFGGLMSTLILLLQDRTAADVFREALTHSAGRAETQTHGCEDAVAQAPTLEPRTASVAECQLNLLEHVEALHHQISSRMDLIERELDGNLHLSWEFNSRDAENRGPANCPPPLLCLCSVGVLVGPLWRAGAS